MLLLYSIFPLLLPICSSLSPEESVYTRVSSGSIRGKILRVPETNATGYVYLGIPYAQPPIGALRYKKPVRAQSWTGTLDCLEYRAACMSNTSKTTSPQKPVSEDCLYMNVFAGTNCTQTRPCPTLLYIHGGGHNFDSPRMFKPEVIVNNFASTGLVFATVGYRLGSFGFFTTGTLEAAGNWGIYDMVASLEWVRDEVANFGGSPEEVTIMGHSSSATDVSLLTLSPKVSGLFKRSISMSSNAMANGTLAQGEDITVSRVLATEVGCTTDQQWTNGDFAQVLNCMRNKTGHELLLAQRAMDDVHIDFPGPSVDGPDGLFPLPALELAQTRQSYDIMLGTTKNEESSLKETFANATGMTLAERCLTFVPENGFKHVRRVANACVKAYNTTGNYAVEITDLVEAVVFFVPTFRDAHNMSRTASKPSVYLYSFDYVKKGLEGTAPWHSMDLTYVMGIHPFSYDERDWEIQAIYPSYFSNFAKYGNPTPWDNEWKPLNPNGYNFWSVDLPKPQNKPVYHARDVIFWTEFGPILDQFEAPTNKLLLQSSSDGKKSSTNWETAFWITLSLGILILLALITVIAIQKCASKRSQSPISDEDHERGEYGSQEETTALLK